MKSSGLPFVSPVLLLVLVVGGVIVLAGWNWSTARRQDDLERAGSGQITAAMSRQQAIDLLVSQGQQAVPQMIEQIASEDVKQRRDAAQVLLRLGPWAAPAADALEARLEDPDGDVRETAIMALTEAGQFQPRRAVRVIARVRDRNSEVRRAAADYLAALENPLLEEALLVPELPVRERRYLLMERARRTGNCDDQIIALLRALAADPEEPHLLRADAFEMLGWFDALTLHDTLDAVASGAPDLTALAVVECARWGPAAASATPRLARMLGFGNAWVDAAVFDALASFGPAGREAQPDVERVLADSFTTDRAAGYRALLAISADRNAVVDAVRRKVESRVGGRELASLLAQIDPQAARAAAAALVRPPDSGERPADLPYEILAALGTFAEPALPALLDSLQPRPYYWKTALLALRPFGQAAAPALPVLLEWLDAPSSSRDDDRSDIILALASMGPAARSAVPRLFQLWRECNLPDEQRPPHAYHVRRAVLQALCSIDPCQPELLAILKTKMESEPLIEQGYLLELLARCHCPELDGLPLALRAIRGGPRSSALIFLASLPALSDESVAAIADMAANPRETVQDRVQAIELLARHPAHAAAALPVLEALLREQPGALARPPRLTGRSRTQSAWEREVSWRRHLRAAARRTIETIRQAGP